MAVISISITEASIPKATVWPGSARDRSSSSTVAAVRPSARISTSVMRRLAGPRGCSSLTAATGPGSASSSRRNSPRGSLKAPTTQAVSPEPSTARAGRSSTV